MQEVGILGSMDPLSESDLDIPVGGELSVKRFSLQRPPGKSTASSMRTIMGMPMCVLHGFQMEIISLKVMLED